MSRLMHHRRGERGYSLVDVLTGVVLSSLVIVVVYRVFIPTLALSRQTDERLIRQQDVRLAVDRLARDLHETAGTRVHIYTTGEGCSGASEGCIGFATARLGCSEAFQVRAGDGSPDWQAIVYVWRDTASNELRRACVPRAFDMPVIPATTWPSTLTTDTVLGREVVSLAFTATPSGVEIALRERAVTASRSTYRYQTEFLNQTVFVPQNP